MPVDPRTFLMAGGGTGGHVIPLIAVARELQAHGHQPVFIGTRTGFEAKLVPNAGFRIEWIEIGGLKRVGPVQTLRTAWQLPKSVVKALRIIKRERPAAVFSLGGYAAGPVVIAAWLRGVPIVAMEPNAMPGFTHRRMAHLLSRALLAFSETAKYFPSGRSEITGLPVRAEFFAIAERLPALPLNVLITGGSQGSRTLNRAARDSWEYFRKARAPIRLLHQTGAAAHQEIADAFRASGLDGEVTPFIGDMPDAFAAADLLVCRSGAGTVSELAAAGKASLLVPFPFASDDHQRHNAQTLARAGAAVMVLDRELSGRRLFDEIESLRAQPELLLAMGRNARAFARPGAARRAAAVLEELIHV